MKPGGSRRPRCIRNKGGVAVYTEKEAEKGVTYPKGFQACGVRAGLKKSGKLDMAMIYSDVRASAAGTFTQNAVAAAPVWVSRELLSDGHAQAVVINSGCANACTGDQGLADARQMAAIAADKLGCAAEDVVVASTGVIGTLLDMEKIESGIEMCRQALYYDGSETASRAILTTDTVTKSAAAETVIDGKTVRFGVIAKGSGMIRPNMATMLCFITTDAAIAPALLREALTEAVNYSFNMISVDGDMSTNDMCVVLANGLAGNREITEKGADYDAFYEVLLHLCQDMAKKIAADGEGATKFLTIHVRGTRTFADAKTVGMSVARSPLAKTAFFGEDANWGRVVAAVGYSGAPMVPEKTRVAFGDIVVYDKGLPVPFDEEVMKGVMKAHAIVIDIDMGLGTEEATVWTCDFSYDYVKINGAYRT